MKENSFRPTPYSAFIPGVRSIVERLFTNQTYDYLAHSSSQTR